MPVRIRWFHYLTVDAKAAEAYLNRMAQRGWAFQGSLLGFGKFAPVKGVPPVYWVEPRPLKRLSDGDTFDRSREAYLTLCADAGWALVQEKGELRIFRSLTGRDPAPLQTDPALDFEANWSRVLRGQQWSALFSAFYFVFLVAFLFRDAIWLCLLRPGTILLLLLFGALVLSHLAYGLYLAHRRRQCRKALDRGQDLPITSPLGARLRGLEAPATLVCATALILLVNLPMSPQSQTLASAADFAGLESMPVLRAEDAGGQASMGLLWEESSPWMSRIQVLLMGNTPLLLTQRYALPGFLAPLVAQSLVAQENNRASTLAHLHDPLALTPADLGFDQAWVGRRGDLQVLVLRQGNVAACVEGPLDFSDPAVLDMVRARLQLEVTQ